MSTWIEEMNGHHSVDYPTYYEVSQNNTGRQRIILNHLMYSLTINFSAIKGRVYLVLPVLVRKSSITMYMYLVFDCKYINVYVYYYPLTLMMTKTMLLQNYITKIPRTFLQIGILQQ